METPPENAEARLIIHMPDLHPVEGRTVFSQNVTFFSPGLPGTENEPFYVAPDFPFDSRTAQACLHDLIAFGEQVRHARDLAAITLEAEQEESRSDDLKREMAAIAHFEVTGEVVADSGETDNAVDPERASAEAAQKALILAWNLEERVAELGSLESKLSDARAVLDEMISGEPGLADDDLAELGELPGLDDVSTELSGMGETVTRLAWRTVFDAMLRFAPADVSFETDDAEAIGSIAESIAPVVLEDNKGMCACTADGWKLLGHSRLPHDRPWLNRSVTVYFSAAAAKAAGLEL